MSAARTTVLATGAWSGPVFVLGMPRSGTKLLRSLLNQHPAIAIPESETEFFPYWVQHWERFGDLSDFANFERFVERQRASAYFVFVRQNGIELDLRRWHASCEHFTPAEVFRRLVHEHVGASPGTVIWGDKSPSYTTQLPLLREHFPEARFIHIVRDPRDYCVSIHKAWRKNIPRAAVRWRDWVGGLREAGATLEAGRIIHVSYEDLLDDPESVLRKLCDFLGIAFDPAMLHLSKPSENLGYTRGKQEIVRHNAGNYRARLDPRTLATIEGLAGIEMRHWGYEVDTAEELDIPGWKMNLYRLADGVNLLRSDWEEHGVIGALRLHYNAYKMSLARRGW